MLPPSICTTWKWVHSDSKSDKSKKISSQTRLLIQRADTDRIMFEFLCCTYRKKIQKCTKRKTRICLVWTNTTSLSLSELIRRWLSSKHFVPERPLQPPPQKPSKSCWIFSLQGRQLLWLAGTKWALCALKRKKYQPETSYRTFKYKHHTCDDWFVRISVILLLNDHLKPQDHIHVSRFDWLKRNVSDVIAADQTARMLNLETRDLNPARCEITCESPWWLGLFFRGVGSSQSQKTFFMGKSGW